MAEHDEHFQSPENASMNIDAHQGFDSVDQTEDKSDQMNEEEQHDDLPADPLKKLQAERDEMEARLLRVSADYQNFVRRSTQNTENACQQQLVQLTKALLTPLDHFDHALAVDAEKTTSASLMQGVQMVRDELAKALEQLGIKRLEVKAGDPFDPICHEAIQRMAVDGLDSGTVAEEVQSGYLLGDKTVRPAKVVVAE